MTLKEQKMGNIGSIYWLPKTWNCYKDDRRNDRIKLIVVVQRNEELKPKRN